MMTFEDYKREVLEDAIERIRENEYDDWDDCWDDLWLTVTGNDSGSYFCDRRKAMAHVALVIFDEDFLRALEWHFDSADVCKCLREGPESLDVLVRLTALEEMYSEVEEEYERRIRSV